mmetsp:Transcript_9576/g.16079  ORF Transcript_9576/g.16079 Transcript_9576/m.16079 type:complete len:98 (-) Transcript_9576:309-602(-)
MLLDPAVVSSFLYCQNDKEQLLSMLEPLHLEKVSKVLLLPMNDNTDPRLPSGGSHWSLLVRVHGHHFWLLDSTQSPQNNGFVHVNISDVAKKVQTLS